MKWLLLLIAVEFSLAVDSSFLTRNIGSLGTFGGTYCEVFPTTITDELVEIQFYGGSYLDALALRYKTQSGTYYTTSRCCGTGVTLGATEYITSVYSAYGSIMDFLRVTTNLRSVSGGYTGASTTGTVYFNYGELLLGLIGNCATNQGSYVVKGITVYTKCRTGYFDARCLATTCYGTLYNSSSVCSGNGACSAYNTCTCKSGYNNTLCTDYYCYGIQSNVTGVCGNGTCVAPNKCNCTTGYTGTTCSNWYCNTVLNNSTSVCSGNGYCVAPQQCLCKKNYYGTNCQTLSYFCGAYFYNQGGVCNGNGNCTDTDTCSCKTGYYGQYCDMYNCYGIVKNSTSVCSGRGRCTGPSMCECDYNYFGPSCQYLMNLNCVKGYSGADCATKVTDVASQLPCYGSDLARYSGEANGIGCT